MLNKFFVVVVASLASACGDIGTSPSPNQRQPAPSVTATDTGRVAKCRDAFVGPREDDETVVWGTDAPCSSPKSDGDVEEWVPF
jgi:hypothetical protein